MGMKFKIPTPLKSGDKIAILSPSSGMPFLFPWVYQQGIQWIKENFNLQPIEFPTTCQSPEYLAQNPQARADDVNAAFADPSIKAILATTGGNDQIRILPYLDKTLAANKPLKAGRPIFSISKTQSNKLYRITMQTFL